MKLISKCERQFVCSCIIKRQKRLDGREFRQGRTLEIIFGKERGCCIVLQGDTRVLVQVSCDITEPKASTPTEGIIHVNLELSAMAAPDAKFYSRTSEEFVEAQRSIERCIRDSKCIDLESLCIVTASKVWTIRVDIHTLNDDGNLSECASIAAISALAHFKRPEVTVIGTDVTVHSVEEKEPVALNLHHMPISINLALFDGGKFILVDPNEMEEKVSDGCYIMGMNAHQEICFVHRRGVLLLKEDAIKRCEDVAVKRAQEITQIIRSALDDDSYKRATNAPIGFTNLIQTGTILSAKYKVAEISLSSMQNLPDDVPEDESVEDNDISQHTENESMTIGDSPQKTSKGKDKSLRRIFQNNVHESVSQESETTVFEGGRSKWGCDTNENSEEEISETKPDLSVVDKSINSSSDSEEELVFIGKEHLDIKQSSSRGWFTRDSFM